MEINPEKFQSIIIKKPGKLKDSYKLLIDNHESDSESSVTLWDIEIDKKLNFEKHVAVLCQKAGSQLIPCYIYISGLDFRKWKHYWTFFMLSKFNYCILVCSICFVALSQKVEKIHERALQLL